MKTFWAILFFLLAASSPTPAKPLTNVTAQVGFDQKLNAQLPMDLSFVSENGERVALKKLIQKKPTILALVYYECPMLCTEVLNGLERALKPISSTAGKDFEIVTVSIDPRETPQLAARKKQSYLRAYNRAGAEDGWHCLVGNQTAISQLAEAIGFRYRYDEESKQYAHAAGFVVLTPSGKISRYFFGIDFSPDELQSALQTAREEKSGRLVHQLLLLCFHYDPATGKYSLAIIKTLRVCGALTLALLLGGVAVMLRGERKLPRPHEPTVAPVE